MPNIALFIWMGLFGIPTDNDIKISEMYAAARVLEEKIVKKAS